MAKNYWITPQQGRRKWFDIAGREKVDTLRDLNSEAYRIIESSALQYNISGIYPAAKRIFDIAAALSVLFLFAPFFAFIFFIRIRYWRPVIVYEERIGYRGIVFRILRFRSSPADGSKWLERIERLPGLLNVVKGDLSLVGPYPSTVWEALNYEPKHILRFSVKPGFTGLWRLSGVDCTNADEMLQVDLKYIRERNFRLDLRILLKTLFGARWH